MGINREVLLSKRYAVLTCYLLLAVDQYEFDHTLESLYATWKTNKPSRSAFVNLIADLEAIGWITKVAGKKKSSRKLLIDSRAIREALLLDPELNIHKSWLFTSGIFDFSILNGQLSSSSNDKIQRMTDSEFRTYYS